MKHYPALLALLLWSAAVTSQTPIGSYTSVQPGSQTQNFVFPSTHTFQVLARHNDPLTLGGNFPDNFDFTGYLPIGGSSLQGYLGINHELTTGAVSICSIQFNAGTGRWSITQSGAVSFAPVVRTERNCSGAVTPWGTLISCEETATTGDANGDGYTDVGWCIEIDPVTRSIINLDGTGGPDKIWKAGRVAHENAAVNADGSIFYTGADASGSSWLLKFIPTVPGNFGAGSLYALQQSGSTGTWLPIANSTPAQCSNTSSACSSAGATSFNGVEDVEFGPDGKIYFASKGNAVVYRFNDNGATVSNFEVFVGGMNYTINYGSGSASTAWGTGNDNLAFDGEGNLWVLQDGGNNHIWMVKPAHTQASPRVELFGKTPSGSEPTGITFTPDYKYMFISFQHPNSTNSATQPDCSGNLVNFGADCALVLARTENLGSFALESAFSDFEAVTSEENTVLCSWISESGTEGCRFEVERSFPGGDFSVIHTIAAEPGIQHHNFEDTGLDEGVYFYRVRKVSASGAVYLSETISLVIESQNNESLTLYPNPADSKLNLYPGAGLGRITEIKILDASGKLLMQQPISHDQHQSRLITLSIAGLTQGHYTIWVTTSEGRQIMKNFMK